MKVQSKLKRENGTILKLGEREYHFKPESEDGPHVCEVTDEGDMDTLLEITEGYQLADPEQHAEYIERKALEEAERVSNEARDEAAAKKKEAMRIAEDNKAKAGAKMAAVQKGTNEKNKDKDKDKTKSTEKPNGEAGSGAAANSGNS